MQPTPQQQSPLMDMLAYEWGKDSVARVIAEAQTAQLRSQLEQARKEIAELRPPEAKPKTARKRSAPKKA